MDRNPYLEPISYQLTPLLCSIMDGCPVVFEVLFSRVKLDAVAAALAAAKGKMLPEGVDKLTVCA